MYKIIVICLDSIRDYFCLSLLLKYCFSNSMYTAPIKEGTLLQQEEGLAWSLYKCVVLWRAAFSSLVNKRPLRTICEEKGISSRVPGFYFVAV